MRQEKSKMEQKKTSVKSSLMLFGAAVIWGVAFVAQSVGMEYMGPFTFNGVRFLIGAVVLMPVIWYQDKKKAEEKAAVGRKEVLTGGICCGFALCIASLLQQFGILYTTVGKAGFITTLYIIIVPICGIFLHKKIGAKIWGGALIALVGMYLLCISGSFSISKGDGFVLACAFAFSIHILAVDYFSHKVNGVKLSCLQFFTSGVICTILALLLEKPDLHALSEGIVPLLYAGVMSCGVAYTLQVVGQKNVEPTIASLILSLESSVSVVAGWLILDQKLSIRELIGCVLVFAAVILVQLPDGKKAKAVIREKRADVL